MRQAWRVRDNGPRLRRIAHPEIRKEPSVVRPARGRSSRSGGRRSRAGVGCAGRPDLKALKGYVGAAREGRRLTAVARSGSVRRRVSEVRVARVDCARHDVGVRSRRPAGGGIRYGAARLRARLHLGGTLRPWPASRSRAGRWCEASPPGRVPGCPSRPEACRPRRGFAAAGPDGPLLACWVGPRETRSAR